MITCPRCGAENKPTATMCRMCATPLEAPATLAPPSAPYEAAKPGGAGPGEVLCSTCGAVNDSSWAFCQQCGSPLHRATAPPPLPVKPSAPPPPPPTVIAQPPPVAPPTVIAQPPPVAPPTVIAQPPAAPPTVVAPPPAAPPTVIAQPAVPVGSGAGKDAAGMPACNNCGRANPVGSSFCAACGAQLIETTIAMSAPKSGPSARLRLIQEGGGEGEVFKLDNDEVIVGRNTGNIRFPHDGYMSGRHARIMRKGDQFVLLDENSRNGTFKKIDGEVKLKSGDVILIGKQLFRFEVG